MRRLVEILDVILRNVLIALMAAMVIVILPVLIVYWLLKEKIHEAMLAGAVKG